MPDHSLTAREGVYSVGAIVTRELGWAYREQTTDDVGVDALIEVREGGSLTGRLIAAQIKAGTSWFAREVTEGWIFRGNLRHVDYWRSHSLPVILILYEPVLRKAWWVAISDQTVQRTKRGWTVLVPRTQELNRDAGAGLRPLALPDYRKRLDIREFVARRNSAAGTGLTPVGLGTLFCALNKATERIRIATPFLSVSLLWGLRSALYEGIQVRVSTSFWQENEFADEVIRLVEEHSNFELKVHHPGREVGALHAKYFMVDDVLAVYGSANFTVKSWRNSHEQVLASDDPAAIKHLVEAFERKWVDGSALRIQDLADVVQRNPPH